MNDFIPSPDPSAAVPGPRPEFKRERVNALRRTLLANDFQPVAVLTGQKKSIELDWQRKIGLPPFDFRSASTGVLCKGLRAFDVDIDDPEKAAVVKEILERRFGAAPIRTRPGSPRFCALYRAAEDEPPLKHIIFLAAGKVEILGDGQQTMVDGEHPDGGAYIWDGPSPFTTPYKELPAISEEQVSACEDELLAALGAERAKGADEAQDEPQGKPWRGQSAFSGETTLDDIVAALDALPADYRRDMRVKIGMSAYAGSGGAPIVFESFRRWREGHGDKVPPFKLMAAWRSFSRARSISVATLFGEVGARIPGWRKPSTIAAAEARAKARAGEKKGGGGGPPEDPGTPEGTAPGPGEPEELPVDLSAYIAAQDALALAFSSRYGGRFRFDHTRGQWFRRVGTTYRPEETQVVRDLVRDLCREHWSLEEGAKRSDMRLKGQTYRDVETILRADRRHAISFRDWNADPWALATPAGIVDLRTGALRKASPDELFNRCTAVAPADTEDCPVWLEFLKTVTCGDDALAAFLQRAAGYSATGSMREECLFFNFGDGENGKGTFLGALKAIFGDYAKTAEMDMFMISNQTKHLAHLANLNGARFVSASETEVGRRWALSKVKELTGNEGTVSANFMRENPFEFVPEFKLWFLGNAKPAIPKVDRAIRRRLNLIPFLAQPKKDDTLKERLVAEYPAILCWIINGCLAWQKGGLKPPAIVVKATKDYLDEEDTLTRFLDDRCLRGPTFTTALSEITKDFRAWAEANGERTMSSKALAREILSRSEFAEAPRSRKGRQIAGLCLDPARERLVDAKTRSQQTE